MALPDKQFLRQFQSATRLDDGAYWPQLQAILEVDQDEPRTVNSMADCWKRAQHWMYLHPQEPWSPETEALFRLDLQENTHVGQVFTTGLLLQTWTRFGVHTPCQKDRELICETVAKEHNRDLVGYTPRIGTWLPKDVHAAWLLESQKYVQERPKPSVYSTYVYLYGDHRTLNPAQKAEANAMLCGYYEDYPQSLHHAMATAQFHPEPIAWAWALLANTQSMSAFYSSNEWSTAIRESAHGLDQLFDSIQWPNPTKENQADWTMAHTQCLVASAWMQANNQDIGLNMERWEKRTPHLWQSTKNLLPIFDALLQDPPSYQTAARTQALSKLMFVEHQTLCHPKTLEQSIHVDSTIFDSVVQGQTP